MPPKNVPNASTNYTKSNKRKDPPNSSSTSQGNPNNGRHKRAKIFEKRSISTQDADAALNNGELDLQKFLDARKFEINALENGMQEGKGALNLRAFQQVPRDMRRRTASHNVKRVPKRMRNQAKREMEQDNAPTVDPSKRKPRTSRGRVRAETANRLGILAGKKSATEAKDGDKAASKIDTRPAKPKIRKNMLNAAPRPKSKFRKRQIHKTWLPTHLWHAKRARMTEPKNPLWRFSIPITSTEKSYRPTQRATGTRGAVVWDMSYMSTIGLEGPIKSLEKVLRAMGVPQEQWGQKGDIWRSGKRSWSGWLSKEVKDQCLQICPSTIVWCPTDGETSSDVASAKKKLMPQLCIRVHPSAFLESWTELLRLSKLQRPGVQVIDLRFEIGSIDITGPGSTESLLGILHPHPECESVHSQTFSSLAGVTNPGSLPANAILSFPIMDPRLRYPPRSIQVPSAGDEEADFALLETLSRWPPDAIDGGTLLFNRESRFNATRLPSQKAINRRKTLAPPGSYPSVQEQDPEIPIMLLTSRMTLGGAQGTWTLLAPWKCILPIWYGLVHYPLSSGGNPRFGGLQELRQLHFEQGIPWFPADYPGTAAGFSWETDERQKRKAEWERRPKGKRVEWASLDLGAKRKGEIGSGWACDFEKLIGLDASLNEEAKGATQETEQQPDLSEKVGPVIPINYITKKSFISLLSPTAIAWPENFSVAAVRITLTSRGVATPCARIYRLPSESSSQESPDSPKTGSTRDKWLALLPDKPNNGKPPPNPKSKTAKAFTRIPLNTPLPQRVRLLAQSLLDKPLPYPADNPEIDDHPAVPDEVDLIGFVTTGEFNLAEGKGVAIGSIVVKKLLEGIRREGKVSAAEGRLCIVRNAGEKLGRLARWEPV